MCEETLRLATELRHELHAHPELSCEEQWTKARLMDFLNLVFQFFVLFYQILNLLFLYYYLLLIYFRYNNTDVSLV